MSWLSRNFDLVAVTVIAVFVGVGHTATKVVEKPWLIYGADPVMRQVQPHIMEIRREVREELERQTSELQTLTKEDALCVRSQMRRATDEIRRELRETLR